MQNHAESKMITNNKLNKQLININKIKHVEPS